MSLISGQCAFISAGEFSGDLLAAELSHALRKQLYGIEFFGVTGPTMTSAGVQSVASIEELSVMGVLEVARKICEIRLLEQRIFAWVDRFNPRFAVLVDFPGFHFRLAEQFKQRGIPVFQYVAPKVWAWGKGRLPALRDNFTKVLGVLPFEEKFFLENGVNYEYVGSPHADRLHKLDVMLRDIGLNDDDKVVLFLPGSRLSEVSRILPKMVEIRRAMLKKMPDAVCVIPLAQSLSWEEVKKFIDESGDHSFDKNILIKHSFGFEYHGFRWVFGNSLELMKIAKVAVVASGTATLECALAKTPMVVIYKMNDLSFAIAKRLVALKWVSLVNLLMDEEVVKEHIQDLDVELIADQAVHLASESTTRAVMLAKFDELSAKLIPGAANRAAKVIANCIK